MNTQINWKQLSAEQLATIFVNNSKVNISQHLAYYKKVCNDEMVERITKARKIANKIKLQIKADSIDV